MKKSIFTILVMFMPMLASADPVEIDGLFYNLTKKAKIAEVTSSPDASYSGDITIPEQVTYEDIVYDVTSIGDGAFSGRKNITSVLIPNSVTSIGGNAFYECANLISVDIPESVTEIGWGSFNGTGITEITIPKNVKSIGKFAFGPNIKSITMLCGEGTSLHPQWIFCFYDDQLCIHIKSLNDWCCLSIMDPIYHKSSGSYYYRLFLNNEEITDLVISDGVTKISDYAFNWCSSITSVTIPGSVEKVGLAFRNCPNLSSVTIQEGVKYIGKTDDYYWPGGDLPTSVVTNDWNMKSIVIPNSVDTIGPGAFYQFRTLESVTIGSGVKNIGRKAFSNCEELADVYCLAESVPTTLDDDLWSRCNPFEDSMQEYITLHVPETLVEAYKAQYPWNLFKEIVPITDTAIRNAKTAQSAKAFYTLDGVQNDKPQKGINIIRTNEGKTKKVLVK